MIPMRVSMRDIFLPANADASVEPGETDTEKGDGDELLLSFESLLSSVEVLLVLSTVDKSKGIITIMESLHTKSA
jgi:hypothetical protein